MTTLKLGSSSGAYGLSQTAQRLECYRKWELDNREVGDIRSLPADINSIRNMTIGTYFHSLSGYYHINGHEPSEEVEWEGPDYLKPHNTPKEWFLEALRCFSYYSIRFSPTGLGTPIHNELELMLEGDLGTKVTGVPFRPFTGAIDLVTQVTEDKLGEVSRTIFDNTLMLDTGPGIYLFDWKWHQKRNGSEQATSLASHQATAYSLAFELSYGIKPQGFIFLHVYGHKTPDIEPILLTPPDQDNIYAMQNLFQRENRLKQANLLEEPNPTACVGKYGKLCPHLGTRCKRY